MTIRKQLVFMIKDAWKSRGRSGPTDWDAAKAIRHSARPGAGGRGGGSAAPTGASYQTAAEANDRYLDSFDNKP